MIGAFFDVDGTLYTAHMWRGLMEYAAQHGRKGRVGLYYAAHMPLRYLRQGRLISEEAFRKPWVMNMGWILRGWSAAQGDAAFQWVAGHYILPTARDDMIARLREHIDAKHAVILVSAMLTPTLQILGEELQATGIVGTNVQMTNGKYTGRIIPPACMGIEKDRLTRKFLQSHDLQVDLSESYAYADSISDSSLLEMVGHPIAVYPDPQLAALAQENHWDVISKRPPFPSVP